MTSHKFVKACIEKHYKTFLGFLDGEGSRLYISVLEGTIFEFYRYTNFKST